MEADVLPQQSQGQTIALIRKDLEFGNEIAPPAILVPYPPGAGSGREWSPRGGESRRTRTRGKRLFPRHV